MGKLHLLLDIGAQSFTKEEEICDDRVGFLAEGPDLVWSTTAYHIGVTPCHEAIAVQSEQGTEGAVLEPADEEFAKAGDSGSPP